MHGLTKVVVVREAHTASACAIVALCAEHTKMLENARWARIEEVVGFSSLMSCEACSLMVVRANTEPAAARSGWNQTTYLRPLARDATPRSLSPSCA
jgi:hypothetical protein